MQIESVRITGLASEDDVKHLANAMSQGKGVQAVRANAQAGFVEIDYDPGEASVDDLAALLQGAGFNIAGAAAHAGGCCGGCCGNPEESGGCS